MGGRFDHEQDEEYSAATPPPQSTADSSISGDEAYAPSPKKRKGAHKKVVSVPVRDGSRSKSEVYPPPDSWSWRKYGQKPIKGSPYPRGYYRCSSSKGCPARKQVERSRLDPTTLLITYSCEHNHPHPHPHPTTTKNRHHQNPPSPVASSSSDTTSTSLSPEECGDAFSDQSADNRFAELAGELGWLCNVGSTIMDEMTHMVGPTHGPQADHVEFLNSTPIGEDDKFLFGDLGDLPESSLILRRYWAEAPCCGGTG